MPAAPDLLRQRLWAAVLRRRAPAWLVALTPLVAAAVLLPAMRTWLLAALAAWALGLALDAWRWRQRIAAQWAAWLDAAVPALEDSSALLAGEPATPMARLQQQRLQARLATSLSAADYRAIACRRAPLAAPSSLAPVVLAMIATGAAWCYGASAVRAVAQPAATPSANTPVVAGEIYLRVTPPAYTGVAAFETGARDIEVPQYAQVQWCVRQPADSPAEKAAVELSDGAILAVGAACAMRRVEDSLFWRARSAGAGGGARYNIRVTQDQAPQVTIAEPVELIHLLARDAAAARIAVVVRDDYAIMRASLHMTLARGSGENVRFTDREVPLPKSADPKQRTWNKQWTLAELGMEPGDELYFFVRATDNDPENPHTVQSPTYTLRLPGPEAESVESTALPTMVKPESLRSQRQVIIDTEQLVADLQARPKLADLRARSEAIAADQAALRLRYGQFLGEESSLFGDEHGHEGHDSKQPGHKEDDSHKEHDSHEEHGGAPSDQQHSNQSMGTEVGAMQRFGHVHDQEDNATIFDPQTKAILKRALAAMWDAEKALRAVTPKAALGPEYKALGAIKELQAAERVYLHRTAFVPPALKEEKRLSGDMVGAMSYKRAQGAPDDTVPAEVRDLVQALALDGALPALWSKAARDAIGARIADPEQKLAAQRAVQDVQDGCVPCRGPLRAWLRGTLADAPVLVQARVATQSPFLSAWRNEARHQERPEQQPQPQLQQQSRSQSQPSAQQQPPQSKHHPKPEPQR
ncbi:UNVERIFIED_ORG: hypothetical protein JN05_03649 [Zoogloea ramigera]|uniref:DUF4175 family protein n=1 Tax=Duganella zoogloeoides TaxID=75659 RepID=A0ABZ0XXR9_9BURK|nr:hypothetical protein [Duganella zoogloeoides]WQH04174.1 hypothetical protein SR858_24510 [Duganella zoogloeoides]